MWTCATLINNYFIGLIVEQVDLIISCVILLAVTIIHLFHLPSSRLMQRSFLCLVRYSLIWLIYKFSERIYQLPLLYLLSLASQIIAANYRASILTVASDSISSIYLISYFLLLTMESKDEDLIRMIGFVQYAGVFGIIALNVYGLLKETVKEVIH